jgi:multicomponent Na+:H+ antiporter subunit G
VSLLTELASWALIISGCVFVVAGGIGVLRMPDFYTRMHAASLTDSVGTFAILAGLMLQFGLTLATVKLLAIALFLFMTTPTASYALGHAALLAGIEGIAVNRDTVAHEED